jgi:hypothetical protein
MQRQASHSFRPPWWTSDGQTPLRAAPGSARGANKRLFPAADACTGVVLLIWARRAVTRNAIRRGAEQRACCLRAATSGSVGGHVAQRVQPQVWRSHLF